jgi:glycosyltransferase involved in cell wall biosynthesis
MKKTKILHLSSERSWRGGEQQIAYLIDELQNLGLDNMVAVRKHSAFETHCQNNSIKFISLPFSGSLNLKTIFSIKAICKNHEIDLVHLHSSKSHSAGVMSALFGNSVPFILSRRIDFVPKKSGFTQWKYDHQSIRKIICVSDKVREIMETYCRRKGRTVTVHDGIDVNKFLPLPEQNRLRIEFNLPKDTFIIGNTSALEGHKDYFTFIRTIAQLKKDNLPVKAFIVGKGSLEKDLREFAVAQRVTNDIIFTGFRNDIHEILPAFDVFLMTSNEEGLGSSVLDAFAASVPVVSTAAGGIPEMITHNVNGLLADVGDDAKLASHIKEVLRNPPLRQSLIAAGAKRLTEHFSKELMAKKTLKIYEEILSLSE